MAEGGRGAAFRRILTVALGGILVEVGYETVEKDALEILVEMTQSLMRKVGISSRAYCELAGRVEPLLGDMVISMVEMGFNLDGIEKHAQREPRTIFEEPSKVKCPKDLRPLVLHPGPCKRTGDLRPLAYRLKKRREHIRLVFTLVASNNSEDQVRVYLAKQKRSSCESSSNHALTSRKSFLSDVGSNGI